MFLKYLLSAVWQKLKYLHKETLMTFVTDVDSKHWILHNHNISGILSSVEIVNMVVNKFTKTLSIT